MAKTKAPDWKKESDYDYIQKLSKKRLAWEFLRRSEDYQKSYRRAISGVENEQVIKKRFGIRELIAPDVTPLPVAKSRKFFVFRRLVVHPSTKSEGKRSIIIHPVTDAQVAIAFDLAISIPRQVERVEKRLKEALREMIQQGVLKKPVQNAKGRHLDIRYLRVIDADSAGVTDGAIVEALSVGTQVSKRYSHDNLRKDKALVLDLVNVARSIAFTGRSRNKKLRKS
jgi:hypothetical protein